MQLTMQDPHIIAQEIIAGDRRALARTITLVESALPERRQLDLTVLEVLATKGEPTSVRLGISGTPGVGKSTFIEAFGQILLQRKHRVAVLAIDPSSPVSGGSILGDRTRMEKLSSHEDVFIRPSPAGTTLGGVGRYTREAIILCEAAGYDYIIVETVGVGQSEGIVHSMVDALLVLQLPNAGDELQGIKKGILELADLIAVTKVDGQQIPAGRLAQQQLKMALSYGSRKGTPVLTCSALNGEGLEQIATHIETFLTKAKADATFRNRRTRQALQWFEAELVELIREALAAKPQFQEMCSWM